jgi:hypothetical protein
MGRVALDTGLGSGEWPWPGKQIYVLTSRPVPADVPADVPGTPRALLRLERQNPFPDGTLHNVYTLA